MPARHPANKKKERSVFGNIALFTATLLIICVALVAIAGVYFLVIAPPKQPDRLNTSELSDELVFSAQDCTNIFLVGTSDDKASAGLFALIRLDPERGAVYVTSLPPIAQVTLEDRTDTLAGYFSYGGVLLAKDATEQLLGVEIDKYVSMPTSGAQTVINKFGGATLDLPESVNFTDNDGETVNVVKGKQSLNGRQLISLSKYGGWAEFHGSWDFTGYALCSMLNEYMTENNLENKDALFSLAFNESRTDISALDLLKMTPALERLVSLNAEGTVAQQIKVTGEITAQQVFILSDETVHAIADAYGRTLG